MMSSRKGVAFVRPPADYPWNARCVYFSGPDGEVWELYAWLAGGAPGRSMLRHDGDAVPRCAARHPGRQRAAGGTATCSSSTFSIAAVGGTIAAPPDAVIVEARGKLILPGLVNAHTHSSETFFRGRYEGMPLEVWLLYAYPPLTDAPIPPRLLYLRTLLLAMESPKSGVTMLSDDFFDPPIHDPARLAVVFDAYEAAGIRANVSSAVVDIPMLDTLPFARDVVPAHLQALLDGAAMITPAAYAAFLPGRLRHAAWPRCRPPAFHGRARRRSAARPRCSRPAPRWPAITACRSTRMCWKPRPRNNTQ